MLPNDGALAVADPPNIPPPVDGAAAPKVDPAPPPNVGPDPKVEVAPNPEELGEAAAPKAGGDPNAGGDPKAGGAPKPPKNFKQIKILSFIFGFYNSIYIPAGLVGVFPAPPENAPKAVVDPPDAEPAPPKIEDEFEFPAKAVPAPPPPKMD